MTLKGKNIMVILYTTHCPKCTVLEKKLKMTNISYITNDNVSEMLSLGLTETPILKVDNKYMNFKEAITWIGEQIGNFLYSQEIIGYVTLEFITFHDGKKVCYWGLDMKYGVTNQICDLQFSYISIFYNST